MKEIDARGLACPAPVLQTKAALQEAPTDQIGVVVDNAASQQNVQRFLESQGFTTTLEKRGDDYLVVGTGDPEAAAAAPPLATRPLAGRQKILVMCATDRMGEGDEDLGCKLMVNYIRTLGEMGADLWRLIFVNNGVKLTVAGSAVLGELQQYEAAGLKILVCGTCLDHYGLLERKKVGETTNMLDIVTAMQLADKAISL
jgi:selenium metabolism protein YedF